MKSYMTLVKITWCETVICVDRRAIRSNTVPFYYFCVPLNGFVVIELTDFWSILLAGENRFIFAHFKFINCNNNCNRFRAK